MQHPMNIAIVGAGVAGLSVAIMALKKGYRVSLFERQSRITSMGAGVTLWPNAMQVLDEIGVGSAIRQCGGRPQQYCQLTSKGELQRVFDIAQLINADATQTVSILRRDLMDILAEEFYAQGGKVLFQQNVSSTQIADLKSNYDLVIGADGRMNSVVRQTLFVPAPMPQYQGFINIIGTCHVQCDVIGSRIHDIRGDGERFGIVPAGEQGYYWAAGWRTAMDQRRPVSSWFQEMHLRFSDWPAPVKHILSAYDGASLKRIFVHDLDPLPYWHQRNVLIIGDAAHAPLPTSGQGACQALEDAWYLMALLSQHHDLQTALSQFYQQRIAATTAAQHLGRQTAIDIFKLNECRNDVTP